MDSSSPWRIAGFRTLFTASTLSQLGANVGYIAVPLIAVSALGAGPGQVGALAMLSTVAFLVIGLPAGAWVDRLRHRRVLITADVARAALYASVPLAWWLDALTLQQLYLVVVLHGCATVFADIGSQSVLPQVVGRDRLVPANAAVMTLIALGNVAGRGAGGGLVQALSAPVAAACAAAGYLVSALRLMSLPRLPAPPSPGGRLPLRTQIAQGVRHVFGDRELRALALTASLNNLGSQIVNTMLPVLFVRELGLPAGALGLFWAVGGGRDWPAPRRPLRRVGGPVAGPWPRPGAGRPLPGPRRAAPAVPRPRGRALARRGRVPAGHVQDRHGQRARRQPAAADDARPLLGRMNATFRTLLTGALATGAAISGLIGELAGVRVTLWVGACVLATAFLPVFLSPLRTRHDLPEQRSEPPTSGGGPQQGDLAPSRP
ncbi:MFS transporter [Nonomuraea recticatena]|uniref:MFS transporter n=1 Tax=Nonomuraea recticatena TaxID=46178 RepID=UPI003616F23D